jgi:hypothetical protein
MIPKTRRGRGEGDTPANWRGGATIHRMVAQTSQDAAEESNPPRGTEATRPDLLTIAAIAIVGSVVADFIHEGLGHGGMCIATGGQPLALSTVHFECSAEPRLVAAGGTIANLIFGALFWSAARAVKQSAPWRYFFWLLMTFNLLEAGGYFLFSGRAGPPFYCWVPMYHRYRGCPILSRSLRKGGALEIYPARAVASGLSVRTRIAACWVSLTRTWPRSPQA